MTAYTLIYEGEKMENVNVDELDFMLKRLNPIDVEILNLLSENGLLRKNQLILRLKDKTNIKDALMRCKNRELIKAQRMGTKKYYKFRLTELGKEFLFWLKRKS